MAAFKATPMQRPAATLEPVRFAEFLLLRSKITDEQWLAALAEHWSAPGGNRRRIGSTIIAHGFLAPEVFEAEARAYHDEIEVVEIVDHAPRAERATVPMTPRS
jgi:hypothetical protein